MAEDPEPGDVRERGRAHLAGEPGSAAVELQHARGSRLDVLGGGLLALRRGRDQARAEWLREVDELPDRGAALREELLGVDEADGAEAVLRLRVDDRVTAGDHARRLRDLVRAAAEDRGQPLLRHVDGEGGNVERERDLAAHRVDVAQRVRSGDGSVVVGVIDDRREEVDGEDERQLLGDAVDRGVVRLAQTDEQLLGLAGRVARRAAEELATALAPALPVQPAS